MELELISQSDFVSEMVKSVNKKYRIASISLSGGDDFFINGGVIDKVYVENGVIYIELKDFDGAERFNTERIDKYEVNKGKDMYKVTFKDKSYFKIFIS